MIDDAATLGSLLIRAAERWPDRPSHVFWNPFWMGNTSDQTTVTFEELHRRTSELGGALAEAGAAGQPVLLALPSGQDFVLAFWGAICAGAWPVPAFDPALMPQATAASLLTALIKDSGAPFVIAAEGRGRSIAEDTLTLETPPEVFELPDLLGAGAAGQVTTSQPSDLAYLQYSSGSVSMPKGVRILHRCAAANAVQTRQAFAPPEPGPLVTWLPMHHDMGLMGAVLLPVVTGTPHHVLTPETFLTRPASWFQALSVARATHTGAPNFAYDFCAARVRDEELAGLDLSPLERALTGAEPLRRSTQRRFIERFAGVGVRENVFLNAYGLAEATVFACAGGAPHTTRTLRLDSSALEEMRVEAAEPTATRAALDVISCGAPPEGAHFHIVDVDTGEAAGAGRVGEIVMRGPQVADGYWQRPEETAEVFRPDGLHTGDLGFIEEGELFITGRHKDVIIVRGRNLWPQDLEQAAEAHDAQVRPGLAVAFSASAPAGGEAEGTVVLLSLRTDVEEAAREVADRVRRHLTRNFALDRLEVRVVPVGSVPKTTSGKPRRAWCRDAYRKDTLPSTLVSAGEHPAAEGHGARADLDKEGVEQRLKALWLRNLSVDTIDPARDYFDNGGNSLRATALAAAIQETFDTAVSLQELLGEPTLAGMARSIRVSAGMEGARAALWQDVPGDDGHLLWGHLKGWRERPVAVALETFKKHGELARISLGTRPVFLLGSPTLAGKALSALGSKTGREGPAFDPARRMLGRGLLVASGRDWRRRRRRAAPAFTRERAQAVVQAMGDTFAPRLVSGWEALADKGEPVALDRAMERITVEVALEVLFGQPSDELPEVVLDAVPIIFEEMHRGVSGSGLGQRLPTARNRRLKAALQTFDAAIETYLRTWVEQGSPGPGVLRSLMPEGIVPEQGSEDWQDIRDDIVNILVASFGTTGLMLAYTFHALGRSPAHREAVEQEVDAHPEGVGAGTESVVGRTLRESLRLNPPIWILYRALYEEVVIGGHALPGGSALLISPYLIHRHPMYWPDPERFDPDRFLPSETARRPPTAFVPFGYGPHRCIGENIALLEGAAVLEAIVRRFRLEPVDEAIALAPCAALLPAQPVLFKVTRRS